MQISQWQVDGGGSAPAYNAALTVHLLTQGKWPNLMEAQFSYL